jgi:invasion protein IalB
MPSAFSRITFLAGCGAALLSAAALAQTPSGAPAQAQPAQAQTPKVTTEPPKMFGNWALRCSVAEGGARSCLLNQVFVQKETKRQVLRLSVIRKKSDNTTGLVIVSPLGSDLRANATLAVPGVTIPASAFRFCVRDGCYAELAITAPMLAEMQKGGEGQVSFTPFRAANPVTLQVSFQGFAEGYAALLAMQ